MTGRDDWRYYRLSRDRFLLFVGAYGWLGDYDGLVFVSQGEFPEHWKNSKYTIAVGRWLYICGFEDQMKSDQIFGWESLNP